MDSKPVNLHMVIYNRLVDQFYRKLNPNISGLLEESLKLDISKKLTSYSYNTCEQLIHDQEKQTRKDIKCLNQ